MGFDKDRGTAVGRDLGTDARLGECAVHSFALPGNAGGLRALRPKGHGITLSPRSSGVRLHARRKRRRVGSVSDGLEIAWRRWCRGGNRYGSLKRSVPQPSKRG